MASRAEVPKAIFAALNDPALKALCPDGTYKNNAPQSKTRFVVVIQSAHTVDEQFQGTAFETFTYAITAVMKSNSGVEAYQAADRIKAVIESIATIPGYDVSVTQLDEQIDYSEPDPANPDIQWQHVGGLYQIMVSPA